MFLVSEVPLQGAKDSCTGNTSARNSHLSWTLLEVTGVFIVRLLAPKAARGRGLTAGHSVVRREFCINNLLVRIHVIITMIEWTGLAPWEFEFPFAGSLASTLLVVSRTFHEQDPREASTPRAGTEKGGVDISSRNAMLFDTMYLQRYLAHKKTPPPRTLQQGYA